MKHEMGFAACETCDGSKVWWSECDACVYNRRLTRKLSRPHNRAKRARMIRLANTRNRDLARAVLVLFTALAALLLLVAAAMRSVS